MALSNLTPVTRPETILNGSDIVPVTRREYFMQKAATSGGGGGESPVIFIRSVPGGEFDEDNNVIIPVDKTISEIMTGLDAETNGFSKVFFVELPYVVFEDPPTYREDTGLVVFIDTMEKMQGLEVVGTIGDTEFRLHPTETGMFIVASETTP